MPLSDPDFDEPLSIEHADVIVRHITSGRMNVQETIGGIMLCLDDSSTGVRLLRYQMTRRGITRAVAEFYPHAKPISQDDLSGRG